MIYFSKLNQSIKSPRYTYCGPSHNAPSATPRCDPASSRHVFAICPGSTDWSFASQWHTDGQAEIFSAACPTCETCTILIEVCGFEKSIVIQFCLHFQGSIVVGIDYDCRERKVYWTDLAGRTINRASLEPGSESEIIINTGMFILQKKTNKKNYD